MVRNQTDVRNSFYKGNTYTMVTSLPMLNAQGLNNVGKFYCYNPSTGAIYYNVRACGINTAATAYWGTSVATATVATGTVTCSTFTILGNYVTIEYSNTATGAGSGVILQLSVW